MTSGDPAAIPRPARRKYVPAVGPRLRIVLYIVFALFALLGANSVYLASITALEWISRRWGEGLTYQNYFYLVMFGLHLLLGMLLLLPFLAFGLLHMKNARGRKNRRAVRIGYALFGIGLLLLTTGVLLVRIEGLFELRNPTSRRVVYWLHVACPLAAVWLYWLHRLAGPRIRWKVGFVYAGAMGAVILMMVILQAQDPRAWNAAAPPEGERYFEPSLARTASGNWIPDRALTNNEYCLECHSDIYDQWFHSAHHFSSFNNPAYLASIRESREVMLERDGDVKASRWCAGCHDPVPFFSGAFDDPEYDVVRDPTAHAGITCSVCHAITQVGSTRGNADYVIDEPLHYPFAYSTNPVLQWINHTLVKAKPSFHRQSMLKPFHSTAEFCSTCHKVSLPFAVTHYKDFLRGQNHYDAYLLSGVSGVGARSFYYPEEAETNCNGCHMELVQSTDFGSQPYPGMEGLFVHDHTFLGANTAVPWWKDLEEVVLAQQDFLDGVMRVDLFGIREDGQIDGELHAPIRPEVPELEPGESYLLETVIRTVRMGHLFTQGTADSNEIWLEVVVTSGEQVIGYSGRMDENREVDRWSHFVNVFMLDREGRRISRRNAQDIFVPLYNHQIPPGAAQTVHYRLDLPTDLNAPVEVLVRLNYRKFDREYTDFVADSHQPGDLPIRGLEPGQPYRNELPVTVLAEDRVTFPVAGVPVEVEPQERDIPTWQRWNDFGIGSLLKGTAELKQAEYAFRRVEELDRYDGPLNLARVLYREGRLDEAVDALARARAFEDPPAPWWTLAWLSGLVNREQGHLHDAERNFRSVLETSTSEMQRRNFDFSRDYEVINELGKTLFVLGQQQLGDARRGRRDEYYRAAVEQFERTLEIDSENVTAHYNLQLLYGLLGDEERSAHHQALHARYKPDENARDVAVALARERYPAANHAAESLVIYSLHGPPAGADDGTASPE